MKSISLLSLGSHFEKNIRDILKSMSSVEINGLYTRNNKKREELSEYFKCKAYLTEEELFNDKSDYVYISSPNSEHFRQVKACLENKKNVLVEKPALTSLDEFQIIKKIAKKNKNFVMEAFMYQFHNQFLKVKEIIDEGSLGEIKSVEINFGFPHLDPSNFRYSKELNGGATLDAGAYTISACMNLFGHSFLDFNSQIYREPKFEVDVGGFATFIYKKFKVICNWNFGASYRNEIIIWGSEGKLVAEKFFSKPKNSSYPITVYKNYEQKEEKIFNDNNHFKDMFESFLKYNLQDGDKELDKIEKNIAILEEVLK